MSLNAPLTHTSAKSGGNTSSPNLPFAQPSTHASSSAEGYGPRRNGPSAASSAGSASRNSQPSPRNNQAFRKQHRGQKKSRFADEDAMAESAAIKSTNSRKGQTSITHLMNFSLPPRPQQTSVHPPYGRLSRRHPNWGVGSARQAVDQARYVHANYRFVVDPRGDYHAQAIDADVHLEWSCVLQILASAQTQCSACPICLSTPVAPRMARCGHIFCLPCLIRYMHSTDETNPLPEKKARWKKCPICWDSVYVSETRPVRWFTGQESRPPREGDDVVLRLITRQPGSTLALPRDGADTVGRSDDIPWLFAAEVSDYARVMMATEDYMMAQFDGEIEQLQVQEREDELIYGDEPEWTKKAVAAIREAKERARGIGNPPIAPAPAPRSSVEQRAERPPIVFHEEAADVPEMYLVEHAARSGQSSSGGHSTPRSQEPPTTTPDAPALPGIIPRLPADRDAPGLTAMARPLSQAAQVSTIPSHLGRGRMKEPEGHPHDAPYYFYQALLHYYLSPLDIRILKAAFGNFASFPSTILPRVEHVSTGHIVDDELRRRAKYLAHLPQGCEVAFLECDWTDVVVSEILHRFQPDLERRRKKNHEKEMREEKQRVQAEKEEEDKRWAAARRKRPSTVRDTFSDDVASRAPALSSSAGIDVSGTSSSPPWPSARTYQGSAFASLASPSSSPVAPRTVWGTAAVAPASPPTSAADTHDHDMSDHDGWLQGWEPDVLQSESELIAQLQAASIHGDANSMSALNPPSASSSNKKKKGKKITLMSTTARRGA
ncbi:MAG: hypothetical protein M1838_004209 [Thelocarpon superellum]|nr:MAG: hypothetical protein M1838_004209 [Thelocarpon superellum]